MPKLLCDTAGMSEEIWLAARKHGPKGDIPFTIGGSDVSTIRGLNPWKTNLELFHEKLGKITLLKDEGNLGQKEMGHLLEPIVAHWYEKRSGNRVIVDTGLYQHQDYPWALANLDYRVESGGKIGILECKTTTYRKADSWVCSVPEYYESQVRFYMWVMDLDYVDVACLWGTNPEQDMAIFRIERDELLEKQLVEDCEVFIHALEGGIEPEIKCPNPEDALAALAKVFRQKKRSRSAMQLGSSHAMKLKRYASLREEISQHEKAIGELKARADRIITPIIQAMKEEEFAVCRVSDSEVLNIICQGITRTTVDTKKLQKERPEVFELYQKTSYSNRIKVEAEK